MWGREVAEEGLGYVGLDHRPKLLRPLPGWGKGRRSHSDDRWTLMSEQIQGAINDRRGNRKDRRDYRYDRYDWHDSHDWSYNRRYDSHDRSHNRSHDSRDRRDSHRG